MNRRYWIIVLAALVLGTALGIALARVVGPASEVSREARAWPQELVHLSQAG